MAFIAMHGRDGEDGTIQELLEILDIPYTGSGVLACTRSMDKVLAKHLMLEAGIPTPEFFAFNETAFRELGAARRCRRSRSGSTSRSWSSRRARAPPSGSSSPAAPPTSRPRSWRPSRTTRACCSSAT